ncbi:MAG: type III-B CRISPR module RAMP protein Cmr1, partial [bacterium]
MLHKSEIELRIATPLMIGGVTKKIAARQTATGFDTDLVQANLNVNSIRGTMRWWFRAVNGWSKDLFDKKEQEIFGSTKKESKIKIKVEMPDLNIEWWDQSHFPTQNRFGSYNITRRGRPMPIKYNGFKYLSFFNRVPTPSRNTETIHQYYKVGQIFKMT